MVTEDDEVVVVKCACGSKKFHRYGATEVHYELKGVVLTAYAEDKLDMEPEVHCSGCGKVFSPSDFHDII